MVDAYSITWAPMLSFGVFFILFFFKTLPNEKIHGKIKYNDVKKKNHQGKHTPCLGRFLHDGVVSENTLFAS